MDGIHDLGGRHGFGRIQTEEKEEPFHEPWEGRVLGMVRAMSRPPDWSVDWFRHCRELIAPSDYLLRPYYDQWLQTYAAMLVNSGVATVEEIATGKSAASAQGLRAPMSAAAVHEAKGRFERFDRPHDAGPAFSPGDAVRARRDAATGHTRLPGYVRGRAGAVESFHGAHLLPDASARGETRAEPLYTVVFDAAELWPEAAGSRDRVSLEMWESYLEPA